MKNPQRLFLIVAAILGTLFFVPHTYSQAIPDSQTLAALVAADDERVSATIHPTQSRLDAILSEDFRYAHSSGKVDTKTSYSRALLKNTLKYISIKYDERNFTLADATIALMTGKAAYVSETEGKPTNLYLGFLAVYRNEGGHWRFLAWQSCRLTAPQSK
jgi:Domain of unknown function (DUF4440)